MRYILSLLFSIGLFSEVFAADTVRIYNATDLVVNAVSGATYALNVDEPSGDATAETAPATVYLPIKNSTANYSQYFLYSRSGGLPLETATAVSSIAFPLEITVGGTAKYIYTAVKINSTYYVVSKSASTYANQTSASLNFNVSPYLFCTTFPLAGSTNPCNDATTFTTTMTSYFFVSSSNYGNGDSIDVATEAGGVYFSLKLSNRIYTSADLMVSISNVRRGDRRIILDYAATATMSNFSKVKAFVHSSLPITDNMPLGDTVNYAGSIHIKDLATTQEGEATINELVNGTNYDLSLFFVDKFNYTTTLSADISAQPEEIQELLKKQACFLLTAGFGEEHYIINYFRKYRDEVLANTWLGRKFIKVYYRSAPHYAVIIYQSEAMRFSIRVAAYILFFFFKYYWLVLVILSSCYYLNIRKNKILLQNNSL